MKDLKLFTKDEYQFKQALVNVKAFSNNIKMEFGLDKCATAGFKAGKLEELKHPAGPQNDFSKPGQHGIEKYLGIKESDSIHHSKMEETI